MSKTKVHKFMFDSEQWNTTRALRYIRKHGFTPMKRGRIRNGWIEYVITPEANLDNLRTNTIDKVKKIKSVVGIKKTNDDNQPEVVEQTITNEPVE